MVEERSKMDPKLSQNCGQLPKMAPDGAQEWSPSMMVPSLGAFLTPLWDPKNHKKTILCQKGCCKEGFSDALSCKLCFLDFINRFLVVFCMKNGWKVRCILITNRITDATVSMQQIQAQLLA